MSENNQNFLGKIQEQKSDLVVKIPGEIAGSMNLSEGSFVDIILSHPKEYVIEVDKPVIEELKVMKENIPLYKDKPLNEILKDIMFKFNNKGNEESIRIPEKEIKIVEKGSLDMS